MTGNLKLHRVIIGLLCCVLHACSPADRETVYQVSTLQALMVGVYDGPWTARDLAKHGDIGLGTFNGLDGEMVVLDGTVYRVAVNGRVSAMPGTAGVPFANVTFFDTDAVHPLPAGQTFADFPAWMNARLPSLNLPYAFRIEGRFQYVRTRSVPKQTPPYPPLTQAVREQQIFEFHDVSGTVLGFRFPAYLKGVNVDGYHLHFLSDDRTQGGHLMDFTIGSAQVRVDTCKRFRMDLSDDQAFMQADLATTDDDVKKVEKDR